MKIKFQIENFRAFRVKVCAIIYSLLLIALCLSYQREASLLLFLLSSNILNH